jgi:hypothetical protein
LVIDAPKTIRIGLENIEVYPELCVDGHRCLNCWASGKIQCDPRFFKLDTSLYPGYPQHDNQSVYDSLKISLDKPLSKDGSTISELLAGDPLVEIPDGGYTKQLTDNLQGQSLIHKTDFYRATDMVCTKCGSHRLDYLSTRGKDYRVYYRCANCGKKQIDQYVKREYKHNPTKTDMVCNNCGVSDFQCIGRHKHNHNKLLFQCRVCKHTQFENTQVISPEIERLIIDNYKKGIPVRLSIIDIADKAGRRITMDTAYRHIKHYKNISGIPKIISDNLILIALVVFNAILFTMVC